MSEETPENKLGQPPTRRAARRSSTLRSKPVSTMPASKSGRHTVFTQVANLQMSKARQEKIRDALAAQLQRCNEEIERLEAESQALLAKVGVVARKPDRRKKSLKRVFSGLRQDEPDEPDNGQPATDTDGFHYQY